MQRPSSRSPVLVGTPALMDTLGSRRSTFSVDHSSPPPWLSNRSSPSCEEVPRLDLDKSQASTGPPSSRSGVSSRSSSQSTRHRCGFAAAYNLRQVSNARGLIGIHGNNLEQPGTINSLSTMSDAELSEDLDGRNGKWKRVRAQEELSRRQQLQAKLELERKLQNEMLRRERREDEQFSRRQKTAARQMAWTRLANQLLHREEQRHATMLEEEEQLRRDSLEFERQRLHAPIACPSCSGTGKCSECAGAGCLASLYLSTQMESRKFCGRALLGCEACGGAPSGTEELGLPTSRNGTGKCTQCAGSGKIHRTDEEVDALMSSLSGQ